ncbi:hypothetical protein H4R33_000547 [Dimargaris cristalligena]|uniref:Chitin-binding type-4 domain-containing protein n=1 Tax=Dimargaris cristalligena TaxID=215637 RepID=A0A4Q0A109_9FUNG|nr:hypothetical protein H4R33_000547 [Dimargaris cristalligena]RKP39753.1 hypothetical protein BJ085DRAFT_34444 [Dimargaris cristalligena]|eukprot:RKP39753.1 hypothetical protein BJ085DRAFT_34444 [Dimargaris cristalligena]
MNHLFTLFGLAALALSGTEGHGMLYQISGNGVAGSPGTAGSRGNLEFYGTCGVGQGCKGPCDDVKSAVNWNMPKPIYTRDSEVTVSWKRLNHPGGFVRLAIVPFDQSDSWDAFKSNIVGGSCYEAHCGATDPSNLNFWGPLTGSGSDTCYTKIKMPSNLADGKYTIQWLWHGGGIVFGEKDTAFGEFYSCSDFSIQGGAAQTTAKPAVAFTGGDIMEPNSDTCRFWKCDSTQLCTYGGQVPANAHDPDESKATLDPAFHNVEPSRGRPTWANGAVTPSTGNTSSSSNIAAASTSTSASVLASASSAPTTTGGSDTEDIRNNEIPANPETTTSPSAPGANNGSSNSAETVSTTVKGKKCKCRGGRCPEKQTTVSAIV